MKVLEELIKYAVTAGKSTYRAAKFVEYCSTRDRPLGSAIVCSSLKDWSAALVVNLSQSSGLRKPLLGFL